MDSNERFTVLSEHVQLAHRTQTLPAFFAAPQTEREETPAVVLAMHLWGVDASMRAAAERFARAGFVTLVPDLCAAGRRRERSRAVYPARAAADERRHRRGLRRERALGARAVSPCKDWIGGILHGRPYGDGTCERLCDDV